MSTTRPRFELSRILEGCEGEPPLIVSIGDLPHSTRMERRGFLGATFTASATLMAAGVLSGYETPDHVAQAEPPSKALRAHSGPITDLAVSADGDVLASASANSKVKVWSTRTMKLLSTTTRVHKGVEALIFSPSGDQLLSGADDGVVYSSDVSSGEGIWNVRIAGNSDPIMSSAMSGDGSRIYSGMKSGRISVTHLEDRKVVASWRKMESPITSMVWVEGLETLFTASADGWIRSWNVETQETRTEWQAHQNTINDLSYHPLHKVLVSASNDHSIALWSPEGGSVGSSIVSHTNWVNSIVGIEDGLLIVSGSEDSTILIHGLLDSKMRLRLEGHGSGVREIAASRHDRIIFSGDRDGVILVWGVNSDKPKNLLFDPAANEEGVSAVTYSVQVPPSGIVPSDSYDQMRRSVEHNRHQEMLYTMPCGSPIPPNAVCTCNCVPGSFSRSLITSGRDRQPRAGTSSAPSSGQQCTCVPVQRTTCTCDQVCTCVPIPVCQSHRLLDRDPIVCRMAEQVLLLMGLGSIGYMKWSASIAKGALRERIHWMMNRVIMRDQGDPSLFPEVEDLSRFLFHQDEVVAIMSAQLLHAQVDLRGSTLKETVKTRLGEKLECARKFPWYVRYSIDQDKAWCETP